MGTDVVPISELLHQLKRDPQTYKPDVIFSCMKLPLKFERYFENFSGLEQSFECAPSQYIERLDELLSFISQVIQCYPEYTESFSSKVIQTLLSRAFGMHPDMRFSFLKAFMRLKTKNLINMTQAIDVAFKLHRCHDKQVRLALRSFIVGDIRRANKKQKMTKLNTSSQIFLSRMMRDSNSTVAREAVLILLNLFKKNIWNDARTANLIAESCLMKRKKVYVPALRFLLGKDDGPGDDNSDSESDVNEETKIKQLKMGHRVGVKTKNRQKRLERSIKNVHKQKERKVKKTNQSTNFYAINLLNDPQTFSEKLLRKLETCTDRFEIRLLIIDLISRLIGIHKLLVLNFYPCLQRFLRPHQREVTHLLLFAAQASHDQVPPDVMEPLIRTIADNFITERASSEAITVGLNSVREICARCPYALSEDLLSDLIQYRTYRNKNVVAAARSIIRLYRQVNPKWLPKRERGRPTESQLEVISQCIPDHVALEYGKVPAFTSVPGAEIVAMAEAMAAKKSKQKVSSKIKSDKRIPEAAMENSDNQDENENEDEDDDDDDDEEEDEEDIEMDDEEAWESCSAGETSDDEDDGSVSDEAEEIKSSKAIKKPDQEKDECDDSDEWVNVSHSSDEEEVDQTKQPTKRNIDPEILKAKAHEIASSRVFTQEEFAAMRKHQLAKQKRFASMSKRKGETDSFITIDTDEDEDGEEAKDPSQLVSMSAITRLVKRPHQTKAERMEAIEEGRAGREKYGYKVNRQNPHSSTTNREKSKNKTFQMIKHKVKQKSKRSFRDKQMALREHLKTLMKQSR